MQVLNQCYIITENFFNNLCAIISLIKKNYHNSHCFSAATSWQSYWIGISRRDPSDPSDAYFTWDVGGFIDASNYFGSYPFGPRDPNMQGEGCCVVGESSRLDIHYQLCDAFCHHISKFICEKI